MAIGDLQICNILEVRSNMHKVHTIQESGLCNLETDWCRDLVRPQRALWRLEVFMLAQIYWE